MATSITGFVLPFCSVVTFPDGARSMFAAEPTFDIDPDVGVFACLDHDASARIGSTASKTLRLLQGSRGVYFELNPRTNGAIANNVLGLLRAGRLRGASAMYTPLDSTYTASGVQVVRRAMLREVSLMFRSAPRAQGTWVRIDEVSAAWTA